MADVNQSVSTLHQCDILRERYGPKLSNIDYKMLTINSHSNNVTLTDPTNNAKNAGVAWRILLMHDGLTSCEALLLGLRTTGHLPYRRRYNG